MKLKEQLQELLRALQAEESTVFLRTINEYVRNKHDLEDLLQTVQRKDVIDICLGLKRQVVRGVELLSSEVNQTEAPDELQESKEFGADVLYNVAVLSRLLLTENKEAPTEPLKEVARLLHDSALLAASDFPGLQDEVAKLCLEWWQAESPGKDQLTPQTVPYLLVKALTTGVAADVKRCHSMRTALQLFDFDDPSIAHLKMLLLRAAFAPSFLRCVEGRRMIAYMFSLQPAFVAELAAIVKNQIPAGRKSVLDAYGEILYRACSTCTGACLLTVQQNCIQSLMESAILASTPAMASSLRRVLNGLHSQKHMPGVDKMLLELYEPILFRRLNAANASVRRNALQLFIDAFPLRDPDESNLETDKRLNEQFAHLTNMLKDSVPEVRATAVHAVCRILNEFWELIPGIVTAGYIKLMAGELAFDAASPAVRAAVAEGFSALVDNPLAHPLLKMVLPQLEALLFDSATKVRAAMADLLLALRECESLPFYDIVSVEKLLDVLALDVASVSERIQRLLLPTLFPNKDTGPALVAALLRKSPAAGKAFCQYLAGTYQPNGGEVMVTAAGPGVSENQIVALISDLRAHLLGAPISTAEREVAAACNNKADTKGSKKGRSKRKKAHRAYDGLEVFQEEESEQEVLETPESWQAILGGLEALVCGLAAQASGNKCDKTSENSLFLSGNLVDLLERCPTSTSRRAIMAMAAAFPRLDASAEVRGRCLKKLLGGELSGTAAFGQLDELQGAVECICAGASRERLFDVIVASLGADPAEVLQDIKISTDGPGIPCIKADEAAVPGHNSKGVAKMTAGKKSKAMKVDRGKAGEAKADSMGEIDDSLACQGCSSKARGNEMLLCDNCDAAYHMSCLEPPLTGIPAGDWFCSGCDAMMTNGMQRDVAVRCLDILLRNEEQRQQLVASGSIARLLPHLDAILQEQVELLTEALTNDEGAEKMGASVSTGFTMMVYLKSCMHLLLADQALSAELGHSSARMNGSSVSQATECIQQALDWANTLLQHLLKLDGVELTRALVATKAPEPKGSKISKKKAGPFSSGSWQHPVQEAFAVMQACMLVFAEAAKGQVLCWDAVPNNALAQCVCKLALQFLVVTDSAAAAVISQIGSSTQPSANQTVGAAIANVARLARYLTVSIKPSRSTTRDLTSVLQQAQQSEIPEAILISGAGSQMSRAAAESQANVEALEALVSHILTICCQENTSNIALPAVKPCVPGLLSGLCQLAEHGEQAGCSNTGAWLYPVANLLGRAIELEDVPAVTLSAHTAYDSEQTGEADENTSVAANQDGIAGSAGQPKEKSGDAAGSIDLSAFVSENANHPLVKLLLTSAKSMKVQEQLAGMSASAALNAFLEGYSQCSLGALELSSLLGLKGVTSRGKSRTGAETFTVAIEKLRLLKKEVESTATGELQQAKALLHYKLQALFPPLARVMFELP